VHLLEKPDDEGLFTDLFVHTNQQKQKQKQQQTPNTKTNK